MARYANGRIPLHALIHLGGEHYLAPATNARWQWMIRTCQAERGVTLRITAGMNGYRDYAAQQWAYNNLPAGQAAYPGTSSHGGVYNGRDSMAIDVANWGQVGQSYFYDLARRAGFEPGVFDWEPWHIVDWSPWVMPAGLNVTPIPVTVPVNRKGKHVQLLFVKDQGGTANLWTLTNDSTGHVEQTRDQKQADTWAEAWGSSNICSLQGFLNAMKFLEDSTKNVATAASQRLIQEQLADIQAQIDANPSAARDVIGPDDAGHVIRAGE